MSYADLRYNEVRQTSSHNSFQRSEGIYDQVVYWRIRSLEIDLHHGKPFRDALKKDWYIYHVAGIDPDTTVDRFSGFLQICRGIQHPDLLVAATRHAHFRNARQLFKPISEYRNSRLKSGPLSPSKQNVVSNTRPC